MLSAYSAHAQLYTLPSEYGPSTKYVVVDTARYEVTYKLNIRLYEDPKYSAVAYQDEQTLLIGRNVSATYSMEHVTAQEEHDEFVRKYPTEPVRATGGVFFPEDVFKGYPAKGQLTTSYRLFMTAGHGQYTESLPDFGWELHPEKREILGYQCHRATASFRGRTYEAWFTYDIPLSDGPWKFSGLPGLILEVADSDKLFTFQCVGISKSSGTPIRFWTYDHIKTTRKKLRDIILRMHKQPILFCEQAMKTKIHIGRPGDGSRRDFSLGWVWLEKE